MEQRQSPQGFTVVEMLFAITIIAMLMGIYFYFVNGYSNSRMNEQAARVLMQAAQVQEDFFKKEHRYFDAEVSGNGGEAHLVLPQGEKTVVAVPSRVVLTLKTRGKERTAFTGYAFFTGSKVLHKYDSETGKITTVQRTQDEAG